LSRYRAAIVGLGQVGLLFDRDEKRRGVWTHFSAYQRLPDRYDLVAVCDIDAERCAQAVERRPEIRTFASLDNLLESEEVDVLSICTPNDVHADHVEAAAGRVRAIICEKPLGDSYSSGAAAVDAAARMGTLLAVNYYKRFEPAVQQAARAIEVGAIGDIRTALALYTGPLDAVGSHAADLLCFLLGPLSVSDVVPGVSGPTALLRSHGGAVAVLADAGLRTDLIFEVDVIGSEGRIRILDNCAHIDVQRFAASSRYGGYRELVRDSSETIEALPFVSLFSELADVLDGSKSRPTSDGATALVTQEVLEEVRSHVAAG
jgi:predicted dehydrogenase